MSRLPSMLILVTLGGLLPACGSRVYTIPPQEARRAALSLLRGEQAQVIAFDEEGLAVPIEVEPDDQFEATGTAGASSESTWLDASQLALVGESVDHLTLYHRNPGPTLVGIGGGMLGGAWALSVAAAATDGKAEFAVPVVGPLLMMVDAYEDEQRCDAEGGWFCDLSRIGAAAAFVDFLVQAVGAGLVIGGAIRWDEGREIEIRDEDGETALRFSLEPAMLGPGAVGGLVSGHF